VGELRHGSGRARPTVRIRGVHRGNHPQRLRAAVDRRDDVTIAAGGSPTHSTSRSTTTTGPGGRPFGPSSEQRSSTGSPSELGRTAPIPPFRTQRALGRPAMRELDCEGVFRSERACAHHDIELVHRLPPVRQCVPRPGHCHPRKRSALGAKHPHLPRTAAVQRGAKISHPVVVDERASGD
jgi:hypothetical protein